MGSNGKRRGGKPAPVDTTTRPTDTVSEQWGVVGWMAGKLTLRQRAVREVAGALDPSAFTDPDAALVFRAIREVCGRDWPSLPEVLDEIRRRADGVDIDRARFHDAVDVQAVVSEEHFRSMAAAIHEGHEQQLWLDAIADAGAAGADPDSRRAIRDRLSKLDRPFLEREAEEDCSAVGISERWASESDERLIATGISWIDRRFGGGLPTGITAISAMPGTGKSALAGMLMLGALRSDPQLRAVWFRGEMTDRLLWSRFIATWSADRNPSVPTVTNKEARKRTPNARKVNADLTNAVGGRLHIIGAPLSADRIAAGIERHKPGIVVIDYLQKMRTPLSQDRRSEIDQALSIVSDLTTKHDIATIVISSMAKVTSGHSDIGSMTKESNSLDFDAHNYFALWSEKKDKDLDPRPVRLEVVKGRTGGEGSLGLWFSRTGMHFTPQADERFEDDGPPGGRYAEFDGFGVGAGA
jgi:replicative DNA helicase